MQTLPDLLSVALRAASFVFMLQAAGTALFAAIFAQRLADSAGCVGRAGSRCALAALVLVLAQYALEPARMAGDLSGLRDLSLQQLAWHSPAGEALRLRFPGLLLLAFGLSRPCPALRTTALLGALLVVLGFTVVGHSTDHPHRLLLAALLVAHLSCVAFWLGALLPLYQASRADEPRQAAALIDGFSRLALWTVPCIFFAGLGLACALLPDLAALAQPYGRLLLVKVAGFALLLGIAALNKLRLAPAIGRGEPGAARQFRIAVGFEYALIAAVLAVTAVMTELFSPG